MTRLRDGCYGFPKEYKPLPGETLEETLRRDGYPQKEIDLGMASHCRFWEQEVDTDDWGGGMTFGEHASLRDK